MPGSLFCGIHLTWIYKLGHVDCHMPGYISKALTKYQHPKPVTPQHAPYKVALIQYGAWVQRMEVNTTKPLTPKEIKCVQDIIRTLLYYAQAVDPTLLAALSTIVACQSNGTRAVADVCHQLLDYLATHPNADIWYKACNMALSVHMDASYLYYPGGESRAAHHFYLSNCNDKDFKNGAILTLSTIIKHVMPSASEAELAALSYGCKFAAPLQTTLEELGHIQLTPNHVTTNSITAQGLTIGTRTPEASKLIKNFIGSNVGMRITNSGIFGKRVSSITLSTPANIMGQNIIEMYTHFLFLTIPHSPNSDCRCLPGMHAITFFCYLVLTQWSTVLNNNTG